MSPKKRVRHSAEPRMPGCSTGDPDCKSTVSTDMWSSRIRGYAPGWDFIGTPQDAHAHLELEFDRFDGSASILRRPATISQAGASTTRYARTPRRRNTRGYPDPRARGRRRGPGAHLLRARRAGAHPHTAAGVAAGDRG